MGDCCAEGGFCGRYCDFCNDFFESLKAGTGQCGEIKKAITMCSPDSPKHLQALPQAIVFFTYSFFVTGLLMIILIVATFGGTAFDQFIGTFIFGVIIGISLGVWFNYTAFWAARTRNQIWLGCSAAGFVLLGLNSIVGIWDAGGALALIGILPLPGLVKLVEGILMTWQGVLCGFAAKVAPTAEPPNATTFPGMKMKAGATSVVPAGAVPAPKNGRELVGAGGDQGPRGHVMMPLTAP